MTVNPAINLLGGNFGANVRYTINIDNNGDLVADLAYVGRVRDPRRAAQVRSSAATPAATPRRSAAARPSPRARRTAPRSRSARTASGPAPASGPTRSSSTCPASSARHAAPDRHRRRRRRARQQPDRLLRAPQHDRDHPSTLPNSMLPNAISVWATTSWYDGTNGTPPTRWAGPRSTPCSTTSADKNLFNATRPADQRTASGGKFFNNVINTLQSLSSLDPEGAYSPAPGGRARRRPDPGRAALQPTSTLPAPLNGRALADDVIDVELNVTTGGDPLDLFPNRNATGAVPGDGVGRTPTTSRSSRTSALPTERNEPPGGRSAGRPPGSMSTKHPPRNRAGHDQHDRLPPHAASPPRPPPPVDPPTACRGDPRRRDRRRRGELRAQPRPAGCHVRSTIRRPVPGRARGARRDRHSGLRSDAARCRFAGPDRPLDRGLDEEPHRQPDGLPQRHEPGHPLPRPRPAHGRSRRPGAGPRGDPDRAPRRPDRRLRPAPRGLDPVHDPRLRGGPRDRVRALRG